MSAIQRVRPWWRRFKRNGYRLDRCEHCGHRFRWRRDSRFATGNRDGKVFHGPCLAYRTWRTKADERMDVLGLTLDLSGMSDRDVKTAAELRATGDDERVVASNRAFRVFYDLQKATTTRGEQSAETNESEGQS